MDNCIDCGATVSEGQRCAECLAEVEETPNWGQPDPRVRTCEQCGSDWRPSYKGAKYCSRSCAGRARGALLAARAAVERSAGCRTPGCARPLQKTSRFCNPCAREKWPADPEKVKARQRRKTHIRKARTRYSDFTPAQEREMRRKAKCCPLCDVRLLNQPYQPASKELDHIVPLNVGGTHTLGNVRIICRLCNQRRPRDGSDYAGPVTLFALEVA